MMIKSSIMGYAQVGVFCATNDEITLVPLSTPAHFVSTVKKVLGTDVIKMNLCNSQLLGLFSTCSNSEIIIPHIAQQHEIDTLKDNFKKVIVSDSALTAIGNLVVMNDNVTLVSSDLKNHNQLNAKPFKLKATVLIGSGIVATNQAFIAHPETTDAELEQLKDLLKVEGDVGTVNFGNPYVRAGLLANSNGIIAGNLSSGPELNRIDDIFNR